MAQMGCRPGFSLTGCGGPGRVSVRPAVFSHYRHPWRRIREPPASRDVRVDRFSDRRIGSAKSVSFFPMGASGYAGTKPGVAGPGAVVRCGIFGHADSVGFRLDGVIACTGSPFGIQLPAPVRSFSGLPQQRPGVVAGLGTVFCPPERCDDRPLPPGKRYTGSAGSRPRSAFRRAPARKKTHQSPIRLFFREKRDGRRLEHGLGRKRPPGSGRGRPPTPVWRRHLARLPVFQARRIRFFPQKRLWATALFLPE